MDMRMLIWAEMMMKNEYGKVIVWLGVILLLMSIDIITGCIQAYVNHDLKSGKMSTGLLKKFALLLVLVAIVPFTVLLPDVISVSVIVGVYILETLNEFVSIVENLSKLDISTSMFDPVIKRLQISNKNEQEKNNEKKEDE
ncbi:phage holin family protein [Enterococcus sp. AZ103]|uniref:phage holin family protein n=1 Tax=Enterococcus sp. AZ103 TaxID=2774628 RepID=UPI003F1EE849